MRRFEVPIKSTIVDYTPTKDVWLTLNTNVDDQLFTKLNSTDYLAFGNYNANTNDDGKQITKKILQSNNFDNYWILIENNQKKITCINPIKMPIYFYHKRTNTLTILDSSNVRIQYELEDCILIFNQNLDMNEQKALINYLSQSNEISFYQMNRISILFNEINSHCYLNFLLNFSRNESYSFHIHSSLKTVSMTIEMLKNKVLKYNFEKIWKIETVLHEALVNAISYGSDMDETKFTYISYEIGEHGLRIWIRDLGEGFDVKNISVPVGMDALERISGRGIYMMKKFTEAMFYNSKGNEVMLFFEL